jgi:hypothetical protein
MNDTRTSISYVAPGNSMSMSGALHFACANGNARAVRALLRAGSDPETVLDKAGNTALHVAAQKGQSVLIDLLLDAGADPNVVNSVNDTPLHVGAANGHADVVTALLQGGAWFNVENAKGKVAREVAGTAFAASSRVAPKKRVLSAFKAYARNRTLSSRNSSSEDPAEAPAPQPVYEAPSPLPPAQQPSLIQAQRLAMSVPAELREIFVRHNVSLMSAFEILDTSGDGIINADELGQALRALQIELTESEMEAIMQVADNEVRGGIDYRELVSQFVLLAQQDAARQAAEADADREVAATMRYHQEPEQEHVSPQIRGSSAPAAPVGTSRTSSETDSLSLPFSVGLVQGLSDSTGGTPGSGSNSTGRGFDEGLASSTPLSPQRYAEEDQQDQEDLEMPTLKQMEDYLMEVLRLENATDDNNQTTEPEADVRPAAESTELVTVEHCLRQLRACGIGLRDEEIMDILGQVPVGTGGQMDLNLVVQTAADVILLLLADSGPQPSARAPSAGPADQRPEDEED